ncbi:hypothetical protein FY528_00885 [Hymenobacter lutimineralis]|uniref:Uncharacterized protein n=1 Tax=Hymenobacter lutimineralis TaxID=2606448 RepID=A0A5D6VFY2_9BACT|nr:hypothetical protein [Hymenobacter lutimineralis]TYZ14315.1 hypothetical protein FY528_00885 [Hymenobacter lutimineralis]
MLSRFVLSIAFVHSLLASSCSNRTSRAQSALEEINEDSELSPIINSMINYGVYDGPFIGEGNQPSPQWALFERLSKRATPSQFITLTNHASPVIRCYAFKALVGIKSDSVFSILTHHLDDTTRLEASSGCFINNEFTGDVMIEQVIPIYERMPRKISAKQVEYVDSILLHDPNNNLSSVVFSIKRLEMNKKITL